MKKLALFAEVLFVTVPLLTPEQMAQAGDSKLTHVSESNRTTVQIRGESQAADFVGCKSDGQTGPQAAPHVHQQPIPALAKDLATKLVLYASENLGVLAPRDWHCAGLYGANGQLLIVSQQPVSPESLLKAGAAIEGPAIQLTIRYSDSSGRFDVAKVAARLFPSRTAFVQSVIDEGVFPASAFHFGPYPTDKVTRRSDTDVEFETPSNQEGMGTDSRLSKSSDPIQGLALLTQDDTLVLLDVRVPQGLQGVVPEIVAQVRRQYSHN